MYHVVNYSLLWRWPVACPHRVRHDNGDPGHPLRPAHRCGQDPDAGGCQAEGGAIEVRIKSVRCPTDFKFEFSTIYFIVSDTTVWSMRIKRSPGTRDLEDFTKVRQIITQIVHQLNIQLKLKPLNVLDSYVESHAVSVEN